MPNLNRVMLMGNLTRDPELRYLPSNMPVVALGLAINRRWKNQQGEQQEEVTFVDCEAFGRTAEVINQYLKKGRPIFIEGRLKLDQWQDKEGNKRAKMKVIVEGFEFIDAKPGAGGSGGSGPSGSEGYGDGEGAPARPAPTRRPPGSPAPSSGGPAAPPAGEMHNQVDEEDIPF
jgi:single-strand DNA-binding protein